MQFALIIGLISIAVMVIIDFLLAALRGDEPEPGTIVVCGVIGLAFFLAVLHSYGDYTITATSF